MELAPKDQRLVRTIEQVRQQRSRGNHDCDNQSSVSTALPSVGLQSPSSSVSSSSSKRVSEVVQRLKKLQLESRECNDTKAAATPAGAINQLQQDSTAEQQDKPVNRALLPDFVASARLANLCLFKLAPILHSSFRVCADLSTWLLYLRFLLP